MVEESVQKVGLSSYMTTDTKRKSLIKRSPKKKPKFFATIDYRGPTDMVCEKLTNMLEPVYGDNWKSFLKYETLFTSKTHHLVENEFRTVDFLGDSLVVP